MTTDVFSPRSRERQARRYWTEDGFAELVVGVGFGGLALLLWLSNGAGVAQEGLWGVVQAVYILAFVWGTRWVVQRLKWRFTYPRTGYVAYPRRPWGRRLVRALSAAAAVAVAAFLGLSFLHGAPHAWLLVLTLGIAALYLGMAWAQAWPRGAGYALVALLSGVVALLIWPLLPESRWVLQGGLHFALLGAAQIVGGVWALRRYVRAHPRPVEEETP